MNEQSEQIKSRLEDVDVQFFDNTDFFKAFVSIPIDFNFFNKYFSVFESNVLFDDNFLIREFESSNSEEPFGCKNE